MLTFLKTYKLKKEKKSLKLQKNTNKAVNW